MVKDAGPRRWLVRRAPWRPLATLFLLVISLTTAGCGGEAKPGDFAGRWESTSSDAWIEIHEDMTFEAHDYPTGLVPGGDCHERSDISRKEWSGFVDVSTLKSGFLYADGGDEQWWVDRSLTGRLQLSVAICIENLYETFERR